MVAYGSDQQTRDTLRAIFAHCEADDIRAHAVVVDNFESYGLADKQRIHAAWTLQHPSIAFLDIDPEAATAHAIPSPLPHVLHVFSNRNLGFARGNNLAVRLGRGGEAAKLLVLTPDVVLESAGGLRLLCTTLDSIAEAAVAGPRVVDASDVPQGPYRFQGAIARYGSLIWAPARHLLTGRYFSDEVIHNVERGFVYRVMGCFMLIQAADFHAAGGFDEGTFLYAEEAILSERMRSIGRRCYYEGNVVVRHEPGSSIGTQHAADARLRMRFDSDMYYYAAYRRGATISRWIARLGIEVFLRLWVPLSRLVSPAPRNVTDTAGFNTKS